MQDPKTKELIASRYKANQQPNWSALKLLPVGSLGYEFSKFMNHPDVTPIEKLPEHGANISPEIDYLRQRIRLVHDIHHVVCGSPPTEIGEMEISAYYVAQINSPLNAILLGIGFIKCTIKSPARLHELMEAIVKGWTLGKNSPNIFGVKWEEMWEMPLTEVRTTLGIPA